MSFAITVLTLTYFLAEMTSLDSQSTQASYSTFSEHLAEDRQFTLAELDGELLYALYDQASAQFV